MKVAQVVATFPPYHGGQGYVCFHNSMELARRGHDVTVFTLDYGRLSYNSDPDCLKVVRLKLPFVYGGGGIVPQLYRKLNGFDVVHLHYPFYGGDEYVYLASLLRGQKYFLTYHMDVYGTSLLKKAIIGFYDRLLIKKVLRRASMVGALSMEHLKGSKAAGLVDWDRVVELPNGVDSEKFRPREKDSALLEKHGLKDKVVVLFVGNFLRCKGIHLLIEAISRIRDDNVVLFLVGGGYEEPRYKKQVEDGGLGNRVIFAGPKSPDEVPSYYNLADFLVLPSTLSESFGMVVIEAMASGIPAIVSSLPGPSHLVNDGIDGLIAKVGDIDDLRNKVEHLASDRDRRIVMGRNAREKVVGKYDWRKIGGRLEDILLKITNTKV
jgi:glycosyltransferase involved in cell wall biosynthesis